MMPALDSAVIPEAVEARISATLLALNLHSPKAIYLGGSRVQGTHTQNSDFDFFIETDESSGVFECLCNDVPPVHLRIASTKLIRETNSPGFAPTLHLLANSRWFPSVPGDQSSQSECSLVYLAQEKLTKLMRDYFAGIQSVNFRYIVMELVIAANDAENKMTKAMKESSLLTVVFEAQIRSSLLLLAEKFYLSSLQEFDSQEVERSYFLKTSQSFRFYSPDTLSRHPWIANLLTLDLQATNLNGEIKSIFEKSFGVRESDLKAVTNYIHTHRSAK